MVRRILVARHPGGTIVRLYRKCREERGKKEKFKPLSNQALVKLVEREEQRAYGIFLPDAAKEKP